MDVLELLLTCLICHTAGVRSARTQLNNRESLTLLGMSVVVGSLECH